MLKSHPQKDGYPGIHRTILLPRPKSTFSEMWNLITLTVGGSDNTSQICIWSVSHDDGLGETALNSLECWGKNTHPTFFTKLKYLWYINPYGVFGSLWQVTNHLIKGFLQWNTAWQNQCKSGNEKLPKPKGHKRSGIWHQLYPLILITLQGINISHLGKRKIIFKSAIFGGYVSSLEGSDSPVLAVMMIQVLQVGSEDHLSNIRLGNIQKTSCWLIFPPMNHFAITQFLCIHWQI